MPVPKTEKEIRALAGYNTSAGSLPSSHPSVSRSLNCSERRPRLSKKIDTRNEDCQKAFDKVKKYLLNPPILVPPTPGRPLLMYLSVMEASMSSVLGQHDERGRKERAIYYLSKKFTDYETRYTVLEKTCCALTWASQRLRHYMLNYTTMLIARMDPLKSLFENSKVADLTLRVRYCVRHPEALNE